MFGRSATGSRGGRRCLPAVVALVLLTGLALASSASGAPLQFVSGLAPSGISPPVVKNVAPFTGPVAGGTPVTITGANLTGATEVEFGSNAASFSVKSATRIEAIAPPGTEGAVDVTVTTPEGTSAISTSDHFYYVPPGPSIVELEPAQGAVAGGQEIRILGAHLEGTTAVQFGAISVPFVVVSPEILRATTPPGTEPTVEVSVTTPEGTSPATPADEFSYVFKFAEIEGLSPNQGPAAGGNSVTIAGSEFWGVTGVEFGGRSAPSFHVNSSKSITTVAPPSTVEKTTVQVESTFGPSAPEWCVLRGDKSGSCSVRDYYKYVEPTVTNVSPGSGSAAGGTPVTITGSGFGLGETETLLTFAKLPATSVDCTSMTTCTAVTPAHKAGTAAVAVDVKSNEPKRSKPNPAAVFHYE